MSNVRRIELPQRVLMGPDILGEVPKICSDLLLRKSAIMISGHRTYEVAGKKVENSLLENGFEASAMIIDRADAATVDKAQESIGGTDFLLGVGGGKCIDVAKLAAFYKGVPFISVPTSASHDGISSTMASVEGVGHSSISVHPPTAIIADTQIIGNAPPRLLAAGCGDMVANYSAVLDWKLAHRKKNEAFSEYAAALSEMSAKLVMKNSEMISQWAEKSVREVVKSLISSGVAMSIAGTSRAASGSEHLFSHALDRIAPEPALHGEQCGVGTIIMTYLHGKDWKKIRRVLEILGCPVDGGGLGIEPKFIIQALTKAHEIRPNRYTILDDGLDEETAKHVAEETGVI